MQVEITKEIIEAVGVKRFAPFGIEEDSVRWGRASVNLRRLNNNLVRKLFDLLSPHTKAKGVKPVLRDLSAWIEAAEKGVNTVRCKSTKQFSALLFEFMQKQPGYRLYKKDAQRDMWCCYYLGDITFHEKRKDSDRRVIPARTTVELYYMELGNVESENESWLDIDVRGKTVTECLSEEGYIIETPDLKAEYDALYAKYVEIHDKIGTQFLATGVGTDNLDGNPSKGWAYAFSEVILDKGGEPSRVVIDVPYEEEKKRSNRSDRNFNPNFWRAKSLLEAHPDDDLEQVDEDDSDPDAPDIVINVPTFPVVPCFDLRRHMRFRIHVGNLTKYEYDPGLGDKLILPREVTELVRLLISDKSEFSDIVKGKGGGAVILCAGPAGVGKTLTGEVYAEVMARPLYSVQCSQLGTDENELEKELLRCFARALRWNAILLLDEADVYVHARGTDLQQNAIVGVFLRVLEYYNGVLFMTTNRSELVDDAITSRCLARIDYAVPTPENQARIWRVLAVGAGIEVPEPVVTKIVEEWPRLSGRDVKQLLKLSAKVLHSRGENVLDFETVAFVKRFKPTPGGDEKTAAAAGKRLVTT